MALIVGAGTVGSNVALALASIGVRDFTVVDDDVVGVHNLPSQAFTAEQVGYGKAEMLCNNLQDRYKLDGVETRWVDGRFDASFPKDKQYNIIVSAADSMVARKAVSMWARGMHARVIDTRCGGHEIQTWAYDTADKEQFDAYRSTLHADSEADSLPCGGEMYPAAGLIAAVNTLAAISCDGWFYRLADTEIAAISVCI